MLTPSGECRSSGSEIRWRTCPACGNMQWGVSQNTQTGAWYCYRCDARGVGEASAPSPQDMFRPTFAKQDWQEVPLPEYTQLGGKARRYLRERGIDDPGKYGIVELAETTRLLFPYLGVEGRVIYWSTRWYKPDGAPKYVTAPGRKPLFVLPSWKPHPGRVVLVEGILDAILTHEHTGLPVIALGGKVLPAYSKADLRYLAPGDKTIMLDHDALAAALKLCANLTQCKIQVMSPGVDPAEYFRTGGELK